MAVSDEEMPRLKALYERGMQNGVKDLRMVGPEELREIEPYCQVPCVCACCCYTFSFSL